MILPFPTGWFVAAFSHELAPGELLSATLFGREVVMFRAEGSGHVAVADAFCPHLGAHLGVRGRVEGESLRCPFHGFCFDPSGACVATPYKRRLPRARLRTWPVRERNGVIAVWFDERGREPWWEIPELPAEGYGRLRTRIFRELKSHPQETTENSVDLGHFTVVHGYRDVDTVKPLKMDGHYLTARYTMKRDNPFLPGLPPVVAEFEVHVYGLGYSLVEVELPAHGLKARNFVLCTPTRPGRVDLRVASAVKLESAERVARPLGLLPRRLVEEVVGRLAMRAYVHDVAQDFEIWENKRYVEPPALAEGDGPVGPYRKWCRQFYPSAA